MKTTLKLKIEQLTTPESGVKTGQKLEFGKLFSDRMLVMPYEEGKGWQEAVIKKYENFSISPAATVFHYAQTIFEGLKAYYRADGKIGIFRGRDNFRRMNESAKRLCMPELDIEFVYEAMKKLIALDKNWVPKEPGTSLYIRPTMMGVEPKLGLKEAKDVLFFIIMSPVGTYYKNGFAPVSIIVEEEYVRAVRGGLGAAKAGANYAASLLPGKMAHEKGYDQVLWLDGVERKYIEEVGSMNIFFVYKDELVTSALNGSILPGITRDSVLKLAQSMGVKTSERKISIEEIVSGIKSGKITEVFGSGTAAVVSPVGKLHYNNEDIILPSQEPGEMTMKLYTGLTDIQLGKTEDKFGWTDIIC